MFFANITLIIYDAVKERSPLLWERDRVRELHLRLMNQALISPTPLPPPTRN